MEPPKVAVHQNTTMPQIGVYSSPLSIDLTENHVGPWQAAFLAFKCAPFAMRAVWVRLNDF